MRLWRDFKNFAMRGSVLDLAVGVITGVAFGNVVNSLVKDIIMPPIGLLLGRVDFSNLYISLNGQSYHSLVATQAAGAPTINYDVFINTVINFLIIALAVFLMISQFNRLMPPLPRPIPRTALTARRPYPSGPAGALTVHRISNEKRSKASANTSNTCI
jgi:large conductance mechanosensitive channel